MRFARATLILLLLSGALAAAPLSPVPVDHHQHLLSTTMVAPGQKPITAADLVASLDAAGIQRAVLLSNAYRIGSPFADPVKDEYARVIAENDWTANEAAKYPSRLVAFCSFNPLKGYALEELERCARDKRFGRGIKLHIGNSDVDLDNPNDIAKLRQVFQAANASHMALVVHLRPSESRGRPYGAAQARIFIDEVLTAAPDVVVQIAHLAGGGGGSLEPAAEEALAVFAEAFTRGDARVRNLYLDVAGVTGGADSVARVPAIALRLRAIGARHLLYGSDGGDPTDPPPKAALASFRELPLTPAELRAIEGNVASYLPR